MYILDRFVCSARCAAGALLLAGVSTFALCAAPASAQVSEDPATSRDTASDRASIASPGVITGRILDPATGEYLRNAIVTIETADGRRRTVTSGDGGVYRLADVAPGTARITVAFTGYPDDTGAVEVLAGQTVRHDVELGAAGQRAGAGEAIVVNADFLDGDARAIMDQRRSMDIKNNLSVESYGDIADGNPAEFIKFMPGVDIDGSTGTAINVQLRGLPAAYTGVTFNGVSLASADANAGADSSRAFSFEGLSLSSVDSIEISKTTSADMEANSPAGTINIRPKRAFDRRGRRIVVQASGATHADLWDDDKRVGPGEGGYARRKLLPKGKLEYSDTFLDRRLGIVASVSQTNTYIEREQITAGRNYNPTAASPDPLGITSLELEVQPRTTSRFATSLNVDFKATDDLILSLVSSYNRGTIWQNATSPTFTTGVRSRGVDGDALFDFTTLQPETTATLTATNTNTFKINAGRSFIPSFEYASGNIKVDGNAFYSKATSSYDPLGKKGAIAGLTTPIRATGNFSVQRSRDLFEQDWQIDQISGGDWSDPASFTIAGAPTIRVNNGRRSSLRIRGAGSNLTYYADFGQVPVELKTGFLIKSAKYEFENRGDAFLYEYVGPLSNSEFIAAIRSSNELSFGETGARVTTISGSRNIYLPSNYKLGSMFLSNPEHWKQVLTPTNWYNANVANSRNFEERTSALYVMATGELTDRLTARAGVRWERTDTSALEFDPLSAQELEAAGYDVSASTGRATTIEGLEYQYFSRPKVKRKGNYDHFFPSASLKYGFTRDTYLHLGYSRTIQRPEVSVLAGVWAVDEIDQIVRAPNPGLEPSLSDNFSARLAHYFEPVSMVAVNFYMNKVKGLFQEQDLTAEEFGNTDPRYASYTFITTTTVDENAIDIRGVEVEFNHSLSYLPSPLDGLSVRGSFMYNDPEVKIVRVADKVASLSLSYKKGPVQLFLNTLWNDDKYRSTTPSWFDRRLDVSLSGSLEVAPQVETFFSVRNLLNNPLNVIVPGSLATGGGVGDHSAIYVNNGTSGTIGVRARF